MAVPKFDQFLRPILECLADGVERDLHYVYDVIVKRFALSKKDEDEMLESGKQSRIDNRIGWAVTYLVKASLVERTGTGRMKITILAQSALAKNEPIDLKSLENFPSFANFKRRVKSPVPSDFTINKSNVNSQVDLITLYAGPHALSMSVDDAAKLFKELQRAG